MANATGAVASALSGPALVAAFEQGSLGVSVSVSGFLIFYVAGITYALSELGIITPTTKIAGASGGALVATSWCSGRLSPARFFEDAQPLVDECRARSNCQGTLGPALQRTLERMLPADAATRCSGRVFLAMTVGKLSAASPLMVDRFTSRDDLIAAAHASSYIPVWSGGASTRFRGHAHAYDGFFTTPQPAAPGVKACIRINSHPPPGWSVRGLFKAISRSASAGAWKPPRTFNSPPGGWAAPPSGRESASRVNMDAVRAARDSGIDIAPGVFSPLGMSLDAWEDFMVLPPDAALNRHLWDMGCADARAWAELTGLQAAAAARARQKVVVERARAP